MCHQPLNTFMFLSILILVSGCSIQSVNICLFTMRGAFVFQMILRSHIVTEFATKDILLSVTWLRGIVLLRSTEKPKHENQIEKDCSECTHCTTISRLHSNWSGLFLSLSSLAWHDITAAIARLSQIQPFLSAVPLPEVGSTRLTVNLKVIRKNWRNQHLHNHGQSSHYGCALKIPPASNMGSLF